MTRARRRARLVATVRRHAPAASIELRHRLRLRQDLDSPQAVARAREQMEFLVGQVHPEESLDDLGRRYLACLRWRTESRWRPDRFLPPVRIEGVRHLAAGGRGAVVNFLHHGPFERIGTSLDEYGHHLHMMMAPWFFEPDVAPWLHQHRVVVERACTGFSSAEGSAGVLARLAAGQLVGIATDMPGRTPVRFLGRDRMGSFGAARLAHEASRPVLVVTGHRAPSGEPFLRVHEPLLPEQFDDAHRLLEAMLRLHEPAVLAWPEAYEEPLAKWGLPDRGLATPTP